MDLADAGRDIRPLPAVAARRRAYVGGLCAGRLRRAGHFRGTWPSAGIPVHLKGQQRPDKAADVDVLAVLDVDGGYPAALDEHPVEAVVVDGDPAALVEPQHQMRPRDQWIRDAQISVDVAADDHVVACHERVCRSAIPNSQLGRG